MQEEQEELEESEMNELKLEIYHSPNYGSRGGTKPDMIVLHTSDGYYQSGCEWLCNPKAQASTHFFVGKEGQCARLVTIGKSAWGNVTTISDPADKRYYKRSKNPLVNSRAMSANRYTISIETESIFKKDGGHLTEPQHKKLVKLIAYIRRRVLALYGYEIPIDETHITTHSVLTPDWKPNCGAGIDLARVIADVKKICK